MDLLVGEEVLLTGSADTMYFNALRKKTYSLTLTNKRLLLGALFGGKEYALDDVQSIERYKVMFINMGIRFQLKDGSKLELASRNANKIEEVLKSLGKM